MLINCPECKKEISDKAWSCSSCGWKNTEKIKEAAYIVAGILFALFVLGLLISAQAENKKHQHDIEDMDEQMRKLPGLRN